MARKRPWTGVTLKPRHGQPSIGERVAEIVEVYIHCNQPLDPEDIRRQFYYEEQFYPPFAEILRAIRAGEAKKNERNTHDEASVEGEGAEEQEGLQGAPDEGAPELEASAPPEDEAAGRLQSGYPLGEGGGEPEGAEGEFDEEEGGER